MRALLAAFHQSRPNENFAGALPGCGLKAKQAVTLDDNVQLDAVGEIVDLRP